MVYTASTAFFEAIWEAGIRYCFVNLGSDHPSIIEAMVQGKADRPSRFPKIITCPNEMVALSMADGYARKTNKPQCVIVHVDVGTQGLGAAVHNASCGRAPVLIFAGLSPFTIEGEMRGSRTEYIHWIQDVPDQKAILAQYCRYVGEIKSGKNVKQLVNRALSFAMSDPKGPVYLVGAREAMEEELEPYYLNQNHWTPIQPSVLRRLDVDIITRALCFADQPLVITGYCGRNPEAVTQLLMLVNIYDSIRVIDTAGSDLCFPSNHAAWRGLRYGVDKLIRTADVIIVIDCDVPWINTHCKPHDDAIVFHIDVDPLKQQMPVFYINAHYRFRADSTSAIGQLVEAGMDAERPPLKVPGRDPACPVDYSLPPHEVYATPDTKRHREYSEMCAALDRLAVPNADGSYPCAYLCRRLRELCPKNTTWCVEAVTNMVVVSDQIRPHLPSSWFNCGGGGLGWSGGAALGLKLAARDEETAEKERGNSKAAEHGTFICQIVGDGTFLFTVPGSVYWIARRYNIPILTIVLNNKGWNAPRRSLLLVHPDGPASRASNEDLNISFGPDPPDYAGIAVASSGGGPAAGPGYYAEVGDEGGERGRKNTEKEPFVYAAKARSTAELEKVLPGAIRWVREERGCAVVDAWLDWSEGRDSEMEVEMKMGGAGTGISTGGG